MVIGPSPGVSKTKRTHRAILVDIDEVCFPFAHAYSEWLQRNGMSGLAWEGISRYDLDAALGRDDHDQLAERFLNDPWTLSVPAIEGAREALSELNKAGVSTLLCSARFALREGAVTRSWVARHLPGLESQVMLTRESQDGIRIPKGHVAWATGAEALVDDADEHHHHLPSGCTGFLMGRRAGLPSDSPAAHSPARPVRDWAEVLTHLLD